MHVIDEYGKYINHSFDPNTNIVHNTVVAIKPIQKHDEITFDYTASECNIAEPFEFEGRMVETKKNEDVA
jgi:SET domain-containing protein